MNVTGEPTKGGCAPEPASPRSCGPRPRTLDVRGLMAIGATGAAGRPAPFALLRELADRLALPVRSMGMTGDLEVAVAEGATMVRIGTALFGRPRPGQGRRPLVSAKVRSGGDDGFHVA